MLVSVLGWAASSPPSGRAAPNMEMCHARSGKDGFVDLGLALPSVPCVGNFIHEPASIVLLGDSITQQSFDVGGWGQRLSNHYVRRADVVNRGFSGYNTRWVLEVLERGAGGMFGQIRPHPVLVTVFLGANDAALEDGAAFRQHVPLEEYGANVEKIVQTVRAQVHAAGGTESVKVLLITPPPVDDSKRTEGERTNKAAKAYADTVVSLGERMGLGVIDLHTLMMQDPAWKQLLSDGLHLTPEGGRAVFLAVLDGIAKNSPELVVDSGAEQLGMYHPHHSVCGVDED